MAQRDDLNEQVRELTKVRSTEAENELHLAKAKYETALKGDSQHCLSPNRYSYLVKRRMIYIK
jgi:hypothetical protein